MSTLLVILGVSLLLTLALTPIARRLALAWRLVDHPDGRRKIHVRETPVAGGLVVLAASAISLGLATLMANPLRAELRARELDLLGLLLASITICIVGVVDDYGKLRGRHKLLGQVLAVVFVLASGVVVRTIRVFDYEVELGLLAIPFTMFWLLGAINSLNLIDGMDGLLSTVGLIIALAMAAIAFLAGQWLAACVAMALAGSLLGFLRYNFPPASIFLGDSGSMLIGLVVGTLGIQCSLKGPATVALAAPIAVMTVPIFDTIAAILRRKLTGRSLYSTDRGHLHHCLLRRGLSSRKALLSISSFCLMAVIGALVSVRYQNELYAILSALTVVAILIISRIFGYAEFLLVRERLAALAASFLQRGNQSTAHQTAVRLQGTRAWQELWHGLTACAHRLNLKALRLDVNAPFIHEGYHGRWDQIGDPAGEEDTLWRADIPLTTSDGRVMGRLEIIGYPGQEPIWMQIATLAQIVEDFESALIERNAAALTPSDASPDGRGFTIQAEQV